MGNEAHTQIPGNSTYAARQQGKNLAPGVSCIFFVITFLVHSVHAEEVYFDPRLLENNGQAAENVDLSVFALSEKAQVAGVYNTVIYVNQEKALQQNIRYDQKSDGSLSPEITPDLLRALNVP